MSQIDYPKFTKKLLSQIYKSESDSNRFLSSDELGFNMLLPGFSERLGLMNKKIEDLALKFLNYASNSLGERNNTHDTLKGNHRFDKIVPLIDKLIEKTDVIIDPLSSIKLDLTSNETKGKVLKLHHKKIFNADNIKRPQLEFNPPINNDSSDLFYPNFKSKPFSILSLSNTIEKLKSGQIKHPYEQEIESLRFEYENYKKAFQREKEKQDKRKKKIEIEEDEDEDEDEDEEKEKEKEKEIIQKHFTTTVWVNSQSKLNKMVDKLNSLKTKNKPVSVHFEEHNYRSFQGFTCILIFSCQDLGTWAIDAFKLRSVLSNKLNEITANPQILKLVSNSNKLIPSLQRDFSLYFVNVIDLDLICNQLKIKNTNLPNICKTVNSQWKLKIKYDFVDWRIRPLPKRMIQYISKFAICKWYLFEYYFKDQIVSMTSNNHDQERKLFEQIFEKSKQKSLLFYQKPLFDEKISENYLNELKTNHNFNEIQFSVAKQLLFWRDNYARENDESLDYVLPLHLLSRIARKTPLNHKLLIYYCDKKIPPPVRLESAEIINIVRKTIKTFELNEKEEEKKKREEEEKTKEEKKKKKKRKEEEKEREKEMEEETLGIDIDININTKKNIKMETNISERKSLLFDSGSDSGSNSDNAHVSENESEIKTTSSIGSRIDKNKNIITNNIENDNQKKDFHNITDNVWESFNENKQNENIKKKQNKGVDDIKENSERKRNFSEIESENTELDDNSNNNGKKNMRETKNDDVEYKKEKKQKAELIKNLKYLRNVGWIHDDNIISNIIDPLGVNKKKNVQVEEFISFDQIENERKLKSIHDYQKKKYHDQQNYYNKKRNYNDGYRDRGNLSRRNSLNPRFQRNKFSKGNREENNQSSQYNRDYENFHPERKNQNQNRGRYTLEKSRSFNNLEYPQKKFRKNNNYPKKNYHNNRNENNNRTYNNSRNYNNNNNNQFYNQNENRNFNNNNNNNNNRYNYNNNYNNNNNINYNDNNNNYNNNNYYNDNNNNYNNKNNNNRYNHGNNFNRNQNQNRNRNRNRNYQTRDY
ncbi:exosome component 10 [Anaeramoeba flamelloides]|uniref:Exosome component 10 n=1 Tax=Anaeramoeba flamelloides TaxID=1746091 RepID=A0ABQ8XS77_9EUKA|nr:exosome component 10 [Anaeramoeba flamelloides]